MKDISLKLKEFIENEMRSCSMDIGGLRQCMCIGCGEEQWQ